MAGAAEAMRVLVVLEVLAEALGQFKVESAEPEGRVSMAIPDNRVPLGKWVHPLPTIPITHRVEGRVAMELMGEMAA